MSEPEKHPTSLLLAYVQGELEDDDARTVQDHVEGCRRCADEEGGIRMLILDPGPELDDLERARLHHAVIEATGEPRSTQAGPLSRRLAPYLGTAALLALLAVGVMVFDLTGGDDAGDDAATESVTGEPEADEDAARLFNEGIRDQDERSGSDEAASAGSAAGLASGPTPHFEPAVGRMVAADLDRLGRSSEPFRNFADAYRAEEAPALQPAVLNQLTGRLPAGEAGVVRDCARRVLRTSARTAVPVYGGYGSLDGEEVLLLGFTWTPGTSGPLDRFMVWAWPRGSCEAPLVYRYGSIER